MEPKSMTYEAKSQDGAEKLGGMSFEAATSTLASLRSQLYAEGANRNSEVIAVNTCLAFIPRWDAMLGALMEAERFMSYYAGETDGGFWGLGEPKACLAKIRDALTPPDRPTGG